VWDGEDSFRDPRVSSGSSRGFAGYAWELGGVGDDNRSLRTSLWQKLQQSAEFKVEFADRVYLHLTNGGAMTDEKMLERWRGLVKQIELAVIGDLARWGDSQGARSGVNHNAPLITWDDWKTKAVPHVEGNLKGNSARMFEDLKRRGFYPAIDPPKTSLPTGDLKAPAMLTLQNPNARGMIYFTVDGSDPRKIGGDPGATAQVYAGAIPVKEDMTVQARVKDGNTWSALAEVKFW
jgi:hypothetical protein